MKNKMMNTKMDRALNSKSMRSQQGFVLIVSLLILMVITMIGVTAVSTSTLEGRMAHNLLHSMYAFQAAESAIEDTIRAGNPFDPDYVIAVDPTLIAFNTAAATVYNPPMAVYQAPITNAIITAPSTVSQSGPGNVCPGYSAGEYMCIPFLINTIATIDTSNASANHIQGVTRLMPGGV
jgi:hypothetical protein